jgi:ATP-binding cassette, subfamily C, bacterial
MAAPPPRVTRGGLTAGGRPAPSSDDRETTMNRDMRPSAALGGLGGWFWAIGAFSVFVNLLMLTGPLYMLQVYDRVLGSRSEATLLALTLLIAVLFAIMGVLDHARSRLAARVGATVQSRLDDRVFRAGLARAVATGERARPASGLKDLEAVQRFLASPVVFAVFDMPWTPLFIAAIFLFHPWLGWLAVAGGLMLVALAALNQWRTRGPEAEAAAASLVGDAYAETVRQEAETVRALGMTGTAAARWRGLRGRALAAQLGSSDRVGGFSSASKSLRFFLQSAMLGLGAYLVIHGQTTAGAMIAASILLGRALAPVEQAIGGWPMLLRARAGWASLGRLLAATPDTAKPTALPRPKARLDVTQVTVFAPESERPSLRRLSFALRPGQALGVIGASAAGKSTLARVLTGLWQPAAGTVRLDGAALSQYDPETLGRYVGYLPQDVALFDGTVAENIARLDADPDPVAIVAAAKKAGAHEMILALPKGYDTPVAAGGSRLSGGQRQRIGLARALYGDPVLLVLDEPNAHLDAAGSDALNVAVRQAKDEGRAVVVMAHRPAGIAECDLILVLEDGAAKAFGPRDEILRAQVRNYAQIAGPQNGTRNGDGQGAGRIAGPESAPPPRIAPPEDHPRRTASEAQA